MCVLFVLEDPFTQRQPFEYLRSDLSRWPVSARRPGGAMPAGNDGDRLLTPGEVATLFRVDPKTVTRWASAGRIGSIRTPGGHRRFRESEVRGLLATLTSEATAPPARG
jgi:excisionase family DNA binding protein